MNVLDINIKNISHNYVSEVNGFLAGYDKAVQIYNGNFKSDWLLSDIYANTWLIRSERTVKNKRAEYSYTHKWNWDREIINGKRLTDEKNIKLKKFFQAAVFILFESPHLDNRQSITSLLNESNLVMVIISWLFLYEESLNPSKVGLYNITQSRLEVMCSSLLTGGSFDLLKTGQRFILKYEELTGNIINSPDIFNISPNENKHIVDYFVKNEFYKINNRGLRILNRERIRKIFPISKSETFSHRFTLFIRQFEPDLIDYNNKVLVSINSNTEQPSHNTPLIDEVYNKKYSRAYVTQALTLIERLMKLKPLFPDMLPNAESLKFNELRDFIKKNGKDSNVTPWMPLNISMELLNKSIGFILNYGDSLNELYDKCTFEFKRNKWLGKAFYNERNQYISMNIPKELNDLNISTFGSFNAMSEERWDEKSDQYFYNRLRMSPSLVYLMNILHGACILIIAGLKPIRMNELLSLRYDCIYYKENDGYWLEHNISKSGIRGILPKEKKPIPSIVVKGVSMLQRYNEIGKKYGINNIKKHENFLFFGLNVKRVDLTTSIKDKEAIGRCIDVFTDYINLPTDKYGRRWYTNIHELRKAFLLSFFWVFKNSSLDACRWIAGHKDPDHVLRYVEANIPGEEMVLMQAEYAQRQLRLFNSDYKFTEMENIESLNDDVCKHFSVQSISEVTEDELDDWLEIAILKGKYKMDAIAIESSTGEISARVAIIISE